MELHVQREGRTPRRRRGAADGEVDAVAEIRAQRLEVWAQVRRVQALTCRRCMRNPSIYISSNKQIPPNKLTW
jgi:hypothetical protein